MKTVAEFRDAVRCMGVYAAAEIILAEVDAAHGEEVLFGNFTISKKLKTLAHAMMAWGQLCAAEALEQAEEYERRAS